MITRTQHSFSAGGWWLALVLLAGPVIAPLAAADLELATLKSGTDVFTNVTVYGQTATDLFIKHSRGYGNVKISSLDAPTLRLLKLGEGKADEGTAATVSVKAAATVATMKAKLEASSPWKIPSDAEMIGTISRVRPSPTVLAGAIAAVALFYLLSCACMKFICQNAGSKPGWMIWFPVLQMFPLLRAAKMSAWWFVVFLIPLLGMLAHVVWCVKISKACGKGVLTAVLLILPGTNLFAFLYLAFSKNKGESAEKAVPPHPQKMVFGQA